MSYFLIIIASSTKSLNNSIKKASIDNNLKINSAKKIIINTKDSNNLSDVSFGENKKNLFVPYNEKKIKIEDFDLVKEINFNDKIISIKEFKEEEQESNLEDKNIIENSLSKNNEFIKLPEEENNTELKNCENHFNSKVELLDEPKKNFDCNNILNEKSNKLNRNNKLSIYRKKIIIFEFF